MLLHRVDLKILEVCPLPRSGRSNFAISVMTGMQRVGCVFSAIHAKLAKPMALSMAVARQTIAVTQMGATL